MRWKSVALAGAAWPAFAGCSTIHNACNFVKDPHSVCAQCEIEHELRKQARDTWQQVQCDYPRRDFSPEFRDGFLDGFVDYIDRGGNGSLPAVPPAKYTRHKKYFTEDGQCRVKDYFLGFKYGQEIAIATGKRQFYTVPVLLPQQTGCPAPVTGQSSSLNGCIVTVVPSESSTAPVNQTAPPDPNSVLPAPRPLPNTEGDSGTGARIRSDNTPSNSGLVSAPSPPLPVSPLSVGEMGANVPVIAAPKLPPPPADVPERPARVSTPSVLDELPVVPPAHTIPPPVRPIHPDQVVK
jgi:hypothetical protein